MQSSSKFLSSVKRKTYSWWIIRTRLTDEHKLLHDSFLFASSSHTGLLVSFFSMSLSLCISYSVLLLSLLLLLVILYYLCEQEKKRNKTNTDWLSTNRGKAADVRSKTIGWFCFISWKNIKKYILNVQKQIGVKKREWGKVKVKKKTFISTLMFEN